MRIEIDGPNIIHLIEIDLREKNTEVRAFRPRGLKQLTQQLDEFSKLVGRKPFAGINGDFFSYSTGQPIGNQIVNGQIVSGAQSKRAHFALDDRGMPSIEFLNFTGVAWTHGGFRDSIHCINQPYSGAGSALYTSKWLDTVAVGMSRSICSLRLIEPRLASTETLKCVVVQSKISNFEDLGDSLILLSIPTNANSLVPRYKDTVHLFLSCGGGNLYQAIGGGGRILHSGRVIDSMSALLEGLTADFVGKPHPRTFIAFDGDTSTIVLGVVDGRQVMSRGMNLIELGGFLLHRGYTEGINLDGGGSTTMIINGNVVNSPSDKTGERKTANGLFLLTK
jgi:hypothetical protein